MCACRQVGGGDGWVAMVHPSELVTSDLRYSTGDSQDYGIHAINRRNKDCWTPVIPRGGAGAARFAQSFAQDLWPFTSTLTITDLFNITSTF